MVFRWFRSGNGNSSNGNPRSAASSSQQSELPLPRTRPRALTQLDHANPQLQSLFIARIPPEIRILVYEQVLGHDVLHLEPADGILKHSRCFDPGPDDKLGFRHECWKVSWTKEERAKYGYSMLEPTDDEQLLSILLTCRLIYTEAIDTLYTCNTFDMRRAQSLLLLPKVILPHRFQRIRSVKFSTAFECPIRPDFARKSSRFPPDHMPHWNEACQNLASMRSLTDLKMVLAVWPRIPGRMNTIDDESLYFLLEPLKMITVERFTVIITADISEAVKARLGPISFALTKRARPGIGKNAVHSDD